MKDLKSLQDAIRWFADPQHCVNALKQMRWPDGKIICPWCGADRQYWLAKQMRWKCAACRKQFSVKQGTVFEDSPIALDKWLCAVWLIANCKNGISSHEIARSVGVTQKSAWFMLHRIRFALAGGGWPQSGKLGSDGSPVEIDECFVGGIPKNMHASRRRKLKGVFGAYGNNKTAVMGMLDRESRKVRARLIPDATRETLMEQILQHVEKGGTIYTDEHTGYSNMDQYVHETVAHAYEYVRGRVHTNGIENFWSLLKRGLKGTYVAVEPFHLGKYLDEQVFRYNNRATKDNPMDDQDRFMAVLAQVAGKRLTYADLTGKVSETDGW